MSKICPRLSSIDLDGELKKVECLKHECMLYIQAQGTHPQTGELISEFDCSDNWRSVFLVENARRQIETSASIDSFRNEAVKTQRATLRATLDSHKYIPAERVEELPHG